MLNDTSLVLELALSEDRHYTASNSVGDRLVRALADEFSVLYYSYAAHWNVTGPDFQQLHALFKESLDLCQGAIDEVAEQARILGVFAPASLPELLAVSSAPQVPQGGHASALAAQLQRCHEMLKEKYDDIAANDGGDAGVNDLVSALSGKHAKLAWKLRSTVSGDRNGSDR